MFKAISIHHVECPIGCPGCYLLKRKDSKDRPVLSSNWIGGIVRQVLLGSDIKELNLGINSSSQVLNSIHWQYPVTELVYFTNLLYMIAGIDDVLTRITMYNPSPEALESISRWELDEYYFSLDDFRLGSIANTLATFGNYNIPTHKIFLSILTTPRLMTYLPILIETLSEISKRYKIGGLYIVQQRGVNRKMGEIRQITEDLIRGVEYAAQKDIDVSFDPGTMSMLSEAEPSEMLDISTTGAVRADVYSREPDMYLSTSCSVNKNARKLLKFIR